MTPDPELTPAGRHHELAGELAVVSSVLLASGSVGETLHQIAALATVVVDDCRAAALCTPSHRQPDAAASALARTLDELQHSLNEGPCHDAREGADDVFTDDFAAETRWPQFAPLAVEAGVRSAVAYRLHSGGDTLGALALYAVSPTAFPTASRAVGAIFAAHAALALLTSRSQASDRDKVDHLQTALGTREIIGQAQGILMEREKITADQAFTLLRRASQALNIKLRDVAQELVDTGTVPE
jgi:hypothetical protein